MQHTVHQCVHAYTDKMSIHTHKDTQIALKESSACPTHDKQEGW